MRREELENIVERTGQKWMTDSSMKTLLDYLRDALTAAGLAVVPVEPTPRASEIADEFKDNIGSSATAYEWGSSHRWPKGDPKTGDDLYRSMVRAANLLERE